MRERVSERERERERDRERERRRKKRGRKRDRNVVKVEYSIESMTANFFSRSFNVRKSIKVFFS